MRRITIFCIICLSLQALGQHSPTAVVPLAKIVSVLSPADKHLEHQLRSPTGQDSCGEVIEKMAKRPYVELVNTLSSQVTATGGIEAVPGTDKSRAYGVVTVIDAPGTTEDLTKVLKGHAPRIDKELTYEVVDTDTGGSTKFRVRGPGVRLREKINNRLSFTADVSALDGGRIRAGIRFIP